MKPALNALCILVITGSLAWLAYRFSSQSPLTVDEERLDSIVSKAATAPDVFFAPSVIELADIEWGSDNPFMVSLINHSSEAIRIASIKTSCKCTSIDDYERSIESGGEIVLSFAVDAGTTIGYKNESFTVILESGREIEAKIKANVIATYEISAGEVDFKTIAVGEPVAPLSILYSSDRFKLVDVQSEHSWLETKFTNTGGNSFEITLSPILERLPVGRQQSSVFLTTDYEPKAETSVIVKINVHSAIMPFPSRVLLRLGHRQTVVFRDSGNAKVAVVSYESRTREIECKIIDGRLELFAKEGWQGTASISVADRDGNRTTIPVQFIDL